MNYLNYRVYHKEWDGKDDLKLWKYDDSKIRSDIKREQTNKDNYFI